MSRYRLRSLMLLVSGSSSLIELRGKACSGQNLGKLLDMHFEKLAHLRTCGKVWLSSVQRAARVADKR